MLFCTVWAGLALIVNHGLGSVTRAVMICVEIFGGYLFGRMTIRNTADYRRLFVLLTWGFAILAPFAVVELLTGEEPRPGPLRAHLQHPAAAIEPPTAARAIRAQTVFEHPILFGLVGSMAFANVLYIYQDRFLRSVQLAAFFVFIVFTTLSSGPMLSILIQGADRLGPPALVHALQVGRLRLLRAHGLDAPEHRLAVPRPRLHHPAPDVQSADRRRAPRHPRVRQPRDREPSAFRHRPEPVGASLVEGNVDNFWLNHAMRFGLPSAVFFITAIAIGAYRIVTEKTLNRCEANYRAGYLITLAGLVVVLGTVYVWTATAVFVCMYIGAGAWFYTREAEATTDVDRARRAAQARAFAGTGPIRRTRSTRRAPAGARRRDRSDRGRASAPRPARPPSPGGSRTAIRRQPACLTSIASSSGS